MTTTGKTKRTAAGHMAREAVTCPECGKRVGINAHGRIARHGASGRGTPDCIQRAAIRRYHEEKRAAEAAKPAPLLGTDGDALAIEILMDPTLSPAERDRQLATAARGYAAHLNAKLGGGQ